MTFSAFEHQFIAELTELYSAEEASMQFFLTVSHHKGWKKAEYLLQKFSTVSEDDAACFESVLSSLKRSEPIQYILGETEFYGLNFCVNPSVLIPRPETEELVQWIIQSIPSPSASILDIGTGSGCIPIALQINRPKTAVFALDISPDALVVARKNASLNNAEVTFLQADVLALTPQDLPQKFDVLVSNPPYIPQEEKELMLPNVLLHEPHLALFVDNRDALIFYERIADLASQVLLPNGQLFFEINERFGTETCAILADRGFSNIELRKDLNGKDRMVRAQWCL